MFAFPKTASSRCNLSANTERRCLGDRPDFTLFPVQTHGQKPFPALGTGQAGFPLSCVWRVCVRRPVPSSRSPRRSACRLLMECTGPLQSPGCLGSAGLVSGNVHLGSACCKGAGASVPDDFVVQSSLGLGRRDRSVVRRGEPAMYGKTHVRRQFLVTLDRCRRTWGGNLRGQEATKPADCQGRGLHLDSLREIRAIMLAQ